MARIVALSADLLFGSRVQAALAAAGHDVQLVSGEAALREALAASPVGAVVFDLTDETLGAAGVAAALADELRGVRTLGFFSHVDVAAREAAQAAGIELVVPRSRMAREGAELVRSLIAEPR